jgi:hypothetical protein
MILIGEVESIFIFGKFIVIDDDIVRLFWKISANFIVIDDDIVRLFWHFYIRQISVQQCYCEMDSAICLSITVLEKILLYASSVVGFCACCNSHFEHF